MSRKSLMRRFLPKNLWGDRIYGQYMFRRSLGRNPEYPPMKFNDYLFFWKTGGACYDPLVQFTTDKEYAKSYISATVGEKYVIETYRVLRSKEEFKKYSPDRFPCIIKPTHSSGQAVIFSDASTPLNREEMERWFDIDYYRSKREQNYRFLSPKIIVEELFSEDGRTVPNDYKIFCFRGDPKFIQIDLDRYSGHKRNLYDIFWNRIHATLLYPSKQEDDPKPELLDEMLSVARKLSASFEFVRIDLYATATKIKVGELTFVPGAAGEPLNPPEAEYSLGAYFRDREMKQ